MNAAAFRRRAYSVAAARRLARRELPRLVFDFVDGGAEDEISLRRNEQAFDEFAVVPRPFESDAGTRSQAITLFGQTLSRPVVVGPAGLAGLLWPAGELAVARAAAAAGTMMILSHGSTCTFEDVAAASDAPKLLQLFLYTDRGVTKSFVERASASGYLGICLTIDNQVLGQRERDVRNGLSIPLRPSLRHAVDFARHPGWLMRMASRRRLTFVNYAGDGRDDLASLAAHMARLLAPTVGWDDVAWLRSITDGVLVVKGILHPDDARRAVDLGVDGLIVSNHGGRQFDGAVASIEAVPAIVEAVDGRVPVLVDGGIRRGRNVVVARALGATACCIARPYLWGLASAGQAGVEHVLSILKAEVDRAMALGGWRDIAEIDHGILAAATAGSGAPGLPSLQAA